MDNRRKASKLKRSTSRANSRRNTLLQEKSHRNKKDLLPRSRSRTEFCTHKINETEKLTKNCNKKTTMYTLNHQQYPKLSRNNSGEAKNLKTKSFMKPTTTTTSTLYKSYQKKDSYGTFANTKTFIGKKMSISGNSKKFHYSSKSKLSTKFPSYKANYAYKHNLEKTLKNRNRGISGSRKSKNKKNYKGIHRCGSVTNTSPMNSLREAISSRRRNIRKGVKKDNTKEERAQKIDNHSLNSFMKSRKSHSILPNYTHDLREMKEQNSKDLKGKLIF